MDFKDILFTQNVERLMEVRDIELFITLVPKYNVFLFVGSKTLGTFIKF